MTSQEYDIFVCHRGPDTKRNVVSVLSGMLRSKGITCFVDYQMEYGTHANSEIDAAIRSSRVSIIILSPNFATSKWCLNEVDQIIRKGVTGGPSAAHKVVPVFYDVHSIGQQATDTRYHVPKVNRADNAEIKNWGKALKDVYDLQGFIYDSKTTFQWEISEKIVAEVQTFLVLNKIIPVQATKMPISREPVDNYDVFICHWCPDTQHNVVSVLRGMLLSKGISSFVVGYGQNDGGSELNSGIIKQIENSRVHIIFLSPNFVSSKRCLEEIVYVMNIQRSPGTSNASRKPKVLPIFYDVEPSTVRHQEAGKSYALDKVRGSTDEERERWASALKELSLLHGLEYKTASTFQWEALYDIVKKVEASTKEVIPCINGSECEILYVKEINEAFKELELQEKSENVFIVGIYGRNKSEFANLLVKTLGRNFDRVYELANIMEKGYQQDKVSNIVEKMFSDLIPTSTSNDLRRYEERLKDQRCLVVLDDIGNDINKIERLLQEVKSIIRNRSLVVLASQFQQILQKLNVHRSINLQILEDKRNFLKICYTKRDGINDAFLNQLRETFEMLGLDVLLLNEDEVMSNSSCLQNAKVIVCIISKSFSTGGFKSMFTNAVISSKIVYVSYGSFPTDESIPKPLFEVDFEKAAFDKDQFKSMVINVVQTLNQRHEEIMEAIDFPVGLAQRSTDIGSLILDCVSRSDSSVQCFGLVGMGGVGKTTLATSVFNKIHREFERSFFSLDTRAEVQGKGTLGLVNVQKKIMVKLLNLTEEVKIDNARHGKLVLSSRLRDINALIVLDDVNDAGHLDALYEPLRCSLGPKSAVIITTRDRKIIQMARLTKAFEIETLDKETSKWLFYWHAFMKPNPPAELEEVSQGVIEACQGLPLSLTVIGSHLYYNSEREYWEESFKYLQRVEKDIFNVLRISVDGLDSDEEEAFLDICCFLIDEDISLACMVLNACYGMGKTFLQKLENKCLITTYESYIFPIWDVSTGRKVRRIRVHDQLRDMARHMVRQERRDRAWDQESANDILKVKKDRSKLRGLSVWGHIPFPEEASGCKYLPQERESLCPQNFFNSVRCGGLRWLRWSKASFPHLPRGLHGTNIGVLELSYNRNITEVSRLDSSIGRLTGLTYLDLTGCESIKSLPMTSLSSLEHLILDGCYSLITLSFLPTTLRKLSLDMQRKFFLNLESSSLEDVENASLPNLEELSIKHCQNLKRFALHATFLQRFDLTGCLQLKDLDCRGSIFTFLSFVGIYTRKFIL
ncbi:hypothetical protein KP509_22G048700 [Ceratopteris richardii]|uniref:TIR domain-containing protein n=1 Tax=Ceratopteris richardii TaxID=49495 RepID=A0A8T2S4W3_CERRI|nr:hypothetical protein KP509_22G048700 [Ceratopteris richardii]KAH7307172.1 hypothetical protein KP509_22G048700 [Ceratopteris richardii]